MLRCAILNADIKDSYTTILLKYKSHPSTNQKARTCCSWNYFSITLLRVSQSLYRKGYILYSVCLFLQQVIRRRKISPSRSWQAVQLNIPPGKGKICSTTRGVRDYMGRDATKRVFWVSDKASFKTVSSATETS